MSAAIESVTPQRTAPLKIMLAAVEPSADALGAALLGELRTKLPPDTIYSGCGGPLMAREGLTSAFDIDVFSVMGFLDVGRALPAAVIRSGQLARMCESEEIDAAIFVDGWAFSRLSAEKIRRRSPQTQIFKYAAPQVWASRPQRIDFVKDNFDGVLTLLPFEPKIFHEAGVRAEFVGNPNFQAAWCARGDGHAFRAKYSLGSSRVLSILLGSRINELRKMERYFRDAVCLVHEEVPDVRIISPVSPAIAKEAKARLAKWPVEVTTIEADERFDAFAASNAAIAVSGTVTTELAANETPMIVAYRFDPISAIWARSVMTIPHVTILNILAKREIIPEFLQEKCEPQAMAQALIALLTNEGTRAGQLNAFPPLLEELGVKGTPASLEAAEVVVRWLADGRVR